MKEKMENRGIQSPGREGNISSDMQMYLLSREVRNKKFMALFHLFFFVFFPLFLPNEVKGKVVFGKREEDVVAAVKLEQQEIQGAHERERERDERRR